MIRRINAAGLVIIKAGEGCKLKAYRDQRGLWTIGWGHTPARQDQVLTQAEADHMLDDDLTMFEGQVEASVGSAPTSENAFSAFVSLAYNIGPHAFATSTALHRHITGDHAGCAAAMLWFDEVNGKFDPPLLARRHEEAALYMRPDSPVT